MNKTHAFLFERPFDNVPRVGLAVYTLDFEYSPDFSCQITAATNKTATAVKVTSSNENHNNRLYIMYIATDHEQMGIFVPQRLYTFDLSLPNRVKSVQTFDFNFKEEVSKMATSYSDIWVTVYLTGLSTTSEMTNNGYPTNRTSVTLREFHASVKFYTVEVSIGEDYQDVLIDWVECTVAYFIPKVLVNNRYLMNSGAVTLKGYGGTIKPISQSVDFLPLANNNKFENLEFFYGISRIECKDGQSITLLGVEKFYNSPSDSSVRLLLQMETWKLTLMSASSFNYIQYKSLKCSEPGSNCNSTCSKDLRPYYILVNQCNYCQYSCLTCNVTNSDNYCDTCHETRKFNPRTHLCDCLPEFYQKRDNYTCADCFPCATCEKANTCLSCLEKDNMIINTVTSECLCKPGYFGNTVTVKNVTTYVRNEPCFKCSPNCLFCINSTLCLACNMETYLSGGMCYQVCNANERYFKDNNTCQEYFSDLFDQEGRLDFDWSYKSIENEMVIDLVFSQSNMSYYYYQSGMGYTYEQYRRQIINGDESTAGGAASNLFYDDGGFNMNGYTQQNAASWATPTYSTAGTNNVYGGGQTTNANTYTTIIDESALRGEYYGYGETKFFEQLYQNETVYYREDNGIAFGKVKVSTVTEPPNANYVEALARNLVFKIDGQSIPYTIQGLSSNRFLIRTRPTKTYINTMGDIEIKNRGLVRSNSTALEKRIVSKQIDRFDFYSQQQLSSASSLRSSNSYLVDILWGICKYPLFTGFGWAFTPIMMALQYIMSFNYINSNLPLNLDEFLTSFRDFRNPSIFYNPFRNKFDQKVVSHSNIYKEEAQLNQFDRGLDFMKNCWEFFFIPILAFALLGLLYLLNQLFRKCCRRDFCMISKYLLPRAPLLIGAYTLVQALPVSFFFFSQLKDTTFRHPLEPNLAYPTFNTAMAYLAFFLTCTIPILILAWLYYHFNYGSRISKFSDANVFHRKFLNKIDNANGQFSRAQLRDPLWGGDHSKYGTYIFGFAVFGLAIIFGFFLAFFIHDFGWQITGLLFFTVLFLAFTLAASFFANKVIKVFFIIFMVLMLAYLLLHAGIGSNRSIGTYDQWNTGYLGIGILYALLITAILFSAYLLYKFFKQAYENHLKYGCWVDIDKQNEVPLDKKEVDRVAEYRKDTRLKSTFLKNGGSALANNNQATNNINNMIYNNLATSNVNKMNPDDDILESEERIITHTYVQPENNIYEQLVLNKEDPYKKEISFLSKDRNFLYGFPEEIGRMLMARQPIHIDGENRIYDKNKEFIDYYANLSKRPDQNRQFQNRQPPNYYQGPNDTDNNYDRTNQLQINSNRENQFNASPNRGNPLQTYDPRGNPLSNTINRGDPIPLSQQNNNRGKQFEIDLDQGINNLENDLNLENPLNNLPQELRNAVNNKKRQIYVINGQEYEKVGEQKNGNYRLKNLLTGVVEVYDMSNFKKTSSSVIKYNSNSNIKIPSNLQLQQAPKLPNRQIIYNGEEYFDLGYDPYSKDFKLINAKTNEIQRVPKVRYIRIIRESLSKRLPIGSEEYDYEGTDQYGKVYLVNVKNKQRITLSQAEYDKYKAACLKSFEENLQLQMGKVNEIPQKLTYQGEQYEHYGIDQRGRHRLYNIKKKKYIVISDQEYNQLYGSIKSSQDNLLLLQSAVGTAQKNNGQSYGYTTEEQQIEFRLDSETSKFFVFQEGNGEKIYVPKEKIDPDLPIELDENGNLSQNGQFIINLNEAKTMYRYERRTQTKITSSGNIGAVTYQTTNVQRIPYTTYETGQEQAFQQLQENDAINPDDYYKILGIPNEKVVNFQFKPKDVYLTEKGIKGRDVMGKIEKIQEKYPELMLLVRSESNEAEEFWIN